MRRSRLPWWEWAILIALVLGAWAARLLCLAEVPPGWRDDELINIHALSGQVLAGDLTLYFTGASGHEPLYHTLHAALLALVGMNVLGGHLLSVVGGTLTVPLTYVLGRRLLGRPVGLVAACLLCFSFWSLMYSRMGLRHATVLPPALAAFYLLWRMDGSISRRTQGLAAASGLLLALALYTYTVARLLPVVLLLFGLVLALFHRDRLRRWWRPLVTALALAALLTVPLWLAIAQGRSEAAAQGIGADARIAELSVPLRELAAGNPGPLLQNALATLGMFHATGDPEWLYNVAGRPVFGTWGAVLFFAGLGLCLWRWRRARIAFLLVWLAVGLAPALVTLPPASLGHTILIQPAVYLVAALPLGEVSRWLAARRATAPDAPPRAERRRLWRPEFLLWLAVAVVSLFVAATIARDLHDYFVTWPERGMVRFLYRSDYREAARFLDGYPEVVDVAVGSELQGPWDRLALTDDLRRDDVRLRVFDPRRALLVPDGSNGAVLDVGFPRFDPDVDELLRAHLAQREGRLTLFYPGRAVPPALPGPAATFANGLELVGAAWPDGWPVRGRETTLWLVWRVVAPLDLPPVPVVANPPPPGVYSGPRLAVFTHLFAVDGAFVDGDDGLWVDPTTLLPGDRFLQLHRFALPADAPAGPYRLELGLYDPMSGERWQTTDGRDRVGWSE